MLFDSLVEDTINAIVKRNGMTTFHIVCSNINRSSSAVTKMFLDNLKKETINAIQNDGKTALHFACWNESSLEEVIKMLLDNLNEETINATTIDENTALHLACDSKASEEAIKVLLDNLRKETINTTNSNGDTALHCWVCTKNRASLEVLHVIINYKTGKELLSIRQWQTTIQCIPR